MTAFIWPLVGRRLELADGRAMPSPAESAGADVGHGCIALGDGEGGAIDLATGMPFVGQSHDR